MDSTSQRYGFDVEIVIISMSNTYRNDNVVTMSQRYGFDVVTISIRCQIHMVTISWWHYHFDMDLTSQRYGFDVVTISIRCRIHMVMISRWHYRFDMDLILLRYLYDVKSISLRHRNNVIVTIWIRHWNDNDFDIKSILLRCQIHIKTIMLSRYRYHMDLTLKW